MSAIRARARRAPALGALVLFLAGCGGAPERPLPALYADLAALAPSARPLVETRAIDFGVPAARSRMLAGWGPDEATDTATFVWGGGDGSELAFDLVERRDLTLRLRGWSFPFDDGGGQTVTLSVNGHEIGDHDFTTAPATWAVRVPEEILAGGVNRLRLTYRRLQPGAPDIPRAAAWDGIRFDPREAPEPPSLDVEAGAVELPAGSAVEWSLELPPGSRLVWDDVERRGSARFELAVREESGGERVETPTRGGRQLLTGDDPALAGFTLRALGGVGVVRVSGLRIHAPAARGAVDVGALPAPAAAPSTRPNLIVYLVDTLRADHLGCYGYERPTSPELDAFARGAVLFEEGRAQSSWTKPAVATVLTGLYPIAHGAQQRSQRLPESVETIAERLGAAGYDTALFTTNANVTEKFGFAQGWQTFRYLSRSRGGRRVQHLSSAEINEAVFRWLDERDPERPFLLFVHTLDPHDPYRPEEPFRLRLAPDVDVEAACCGRSTELVDLTGEAARERARQAAALYDAEIAQNDASFGALVAELERRGLASNAAILFLSDHGEEFADHGGWKHGWTLHEELLRVPMVLRLPGGAHGGTRVATPAEQIDVAPTLYELAGVGTPDSLPGRSLLAKLAGEEGAPTSFAWLERPGLALASATRAGWKRIRFDGDWSPPLGRPPAQLFDLGRDPRELDDLELAWREPLRGAWLDGELRAALGRFHSSLAAEEAPIDAELEQSLRALGYF